MDNNQYMDFNTMYGLAGDEMERLDNLALQQELDRVNASRQAVNHGVGFNFLDSARLGSDPKNANLSQIEKNYSGGWEAAKDTGSYSDFLKAQADLESRATAIKSNTAGRYGSLRRAYGDDTTAAKLLNDDAGTLDGLYGNDEAFSAEIDGLARQQAEGREKAIAGRKGYVDDYNQRLQKAKDAYLGEYERNNAFRTEDTGNARKYYKTDARNTYLDILNEGGGQYGQPGSKKYMTDYDPVEFGRLKTAGGRKQY